MNLLAKMVKSFIILALDKTHAIINSVVDKIIYNFKYNLNTSYDLLN